MGGNFFFFFLWGLRPRTANDRAAASDGVKGRPLAIQAKLDRKKILPSLLAEGVEGAKPPRHLSEA